MNSGRATREHSIEETARKTNLEAAEEIGRQLRLRDLAGLIVIDFIDMEDGRNDRDVEKRIRDAVKNDRARIQIGKISQFGLLEMSRQRLRAGVIAGSTVPCPHCGGQGIVRSVESTSLRVLRGLEEEAQKQRAEGLTVRVASDVAIYTLNQKRRELSRLETEYSITINFEPKAELMTGQFEIDRVGHRNPEDFPRPAMAAVTEPVMEEEELDIVEEEELDEEDEVIDAAERSARRSRTSARVPSPRTAMADGAGAAAWRTQSRRPRPGSPERRPARRLIAARRRSCAPRLTPSPAPRAVERTKTRRPAITNTSRAPERPVGSPDRTAREAFAASAAAGRGRRGGNRDQLVAGTDTPHVDAPASNVVPPAAIDDRFGVVLDDIDTTPRDQPRVTPNTSSSPSWSLAETADVDTTPKSEEKPAASTKKGWWQRAFKS